MELKKIVQEFIQDESGLTAVEYAIAGGLVVGGMITAFFDLGEAATAKIECLGQAVEASTAAAAAAAKAC